MTPFLDQSSADKKQNYDKLLLPAEKDAIVWGESTNRRDTSFTNISWNAFE
jgi:hypothetical protein